MQFVSTQKQACTEVGVPYGSLHFLKQRLGPPPERGKEGYSIEEWEDWVGDYVAEHSNTEDDLSTPHDMIGAAAESGEEPDVLSRRFNLAKVQWKEAQARHEALRADKAQESLCEIDDACALLGDAFGAVATKLQDFKNSLSTQVAGLTPTQAYKRIDKMVGQVLTDLSAGGWASGSLGPKKHLSRRLSAELVDLRNKHLSGIGPRNTCASR
jgi:hypothetical protein